MSAQLIKFHLIICVIELHISWPPCVQDLADSEERTVLSIGHKYLMLLLSNCEQVRLPVIHNNGLTLA